MSLSSRIANTYISYENVLNYIPIVSSGTNLVNLFTKALINCKVINPSSSTYYTHIQQTDTKRLLTLCVPFLGNIAIVLSDLREILISNLTEAFTAFSYDETPPAPISATLAKHHINNPRSRAGSDEGDLYILDKIAPAMFTGGRPRAGSCGDAALNTSPVVAIKTVTAAPAAPAKFTDAFIAAIQAAARAKGASI